MDHNTPFPPPPPPPPPQQQWNQPYGYPPPGGYQPFNHGGFGMPVDLPGAGGALVCGIVGLVLFFSIIGVIFDIIAIVSANKCMSDYNMYPGRYTEASFRRARSGKLCGIIGLSLFGLTILILVLVLVTVGV